MIACGLDFGTSNSAIGVASDGTAALAPVEATDTLLPSAVFFDYEVKGRVLFGNAAVAARLAEATPASGRHSLRRENPPALRAGSHTGLCRGRKKLSDECPSD